MNTLRHRYAWAIITLLLLSLTGFLSFHVNESILISSLFIASLVSLYIASYNLGKWSVIDKFLRNTFKKKDDTE